MTDSVSIAIIGAGPRGLWAVEELSRASLLHDLSFRITVFDPRPLGYGAAYSIDQPNDLVINVRSSAVRTALGTLDDFRREVLGEAEPLNEFPARATVGKFLHVSWQHAVENLPSRCTVEFERRAVENLSELEEFEHVLLATGHEPAIHPQGMLDPFTGLSGVAAGAQVGIRGAALTSIDAMLALTAGRGGRFTANGYQPSGEEPTRMYPTSRSGRFIQVKPEPVTAAEEVILKKFERKIPRITSVDELKNLLVQAANAVSGQEFTWDMLAPSSNPADELAQSLANPRRPQQSVGLAWRELYPAIVRRVSFSDLAESQEFYELTRTLEPFAFGPPTQQVRKVLALIDAGLVDFSFLASTEGCPADIWVDAVLATPGISPGTLGAQVLHNVAPEQAPTDSPVTVKIQPDGMLPGQTRFAFAGRMSEPFVLGNDSLSRTLHTVIPRWVQTLCALHRDSTAYGLPPLTGRLEPWAEDLFHHPEQLQHAIDEYASPLNILNSDPLVRNCRQLTQAGERHGVDVRVFFARKANKALTFVERVRDEGHGVDVASYRELSQVLATGVPGERIILSAAIKTDQLLQLAIDNNVTISVDTCAEFDRIIALSGDSDVRVAPRLAPDPQRFMPTRFGERSEVWLAYLSQPHPHVQVAGLHLHLHGYSAQDRIDALHEATDLIEELRAAGHAPEFIDMGGGVPMSYLDDADQWDNFKQSLRAQNQGEIAPFTWKADPLKNFYPFHQSPVREQWLEEVLGSPAGAKVGELGLRLHVEPGRSVLDGCGAIIAKVAFIKERSDGLPLVGLEMNRTQLRTTSDDYLVDPVHIPLGKAAASEPYEGFLVGAYCIEDEVIMRRPIFFPQGVQVGDLIAFPNTAGYFMHILESASHQIPLAKNLVAHAGELTLDAIDRGDIS